MTPLITMLEQADCGSRELDWAIAYALGMGTDVEREVYEKHGDMWATKDPALRMTPLQRRHGCHFTYSRPGREGRRIRTAEQFITVCTGPQPLLNAPHYTTSIDAALTLLPAKAWWRLSHGGCGYLADINGNDCQQAATPALALITAILKATPTRETTE